MSFVQWFIKKTSICKWITGKISWMVKGHQITLLQYRFIGRLWSEFHNHLSQPVYCLAWLFYGEPVAFLGLDFFGCYKVHFFSCNLLSVIKYYESQIKL